MWICTAAVKSVLVREHISDWSRWCVLGERERLLLLYCAHTVCVLYVMGFADVSECVFLSEGRVSFFPSGFGFIVDFETH